MYDMTKLKTRYFDVKLKNGRVINIEPPTLKVLRKVSLLSKIEDSGNLTEDDILDLTEAVTLAFNKNKQGYKMKIENVENEFTISEIIEFLTQYFDWVNSIQNSKN